MEIFISLRMNLILLSVLKKQKPTNASYGSAFGKRIKVGPPPQSLGDKINAGPAHRFGQYVSPDGKYLFYTKGTGEKDCNFYWVRFDGLLKKLSISSHLDSSIPIR